MHKLTTMVEYKEIQNTFEGLTITLRHYIVNDKVFIKLDDNFAKANGFNTMEEIYQVSPRLRDYEWIDTKLIEEARVLSEHPVS